MTYSVSYRNHWWHRRRYACGYVKVTEAFSTWVNLHRLGYGRVRLEVSNTDKEPS